MDEPSFILEGTWEEIRQHDAELTGKQVRVEAFLREARAGGMFGIDPYS